MPNQLFRTIVISLLAVIALALCFIAGFALMRGPSGPAPVVQEPQPLPAVAVASMPAAAPAVAPAPVAPMPAPQVVALPEPPKTAPAPVVGSSVDGTWTVLDNGCTTVQTGGAFHVAGTSKQDGWNHWNGVQTAGDFPEGDFTASVDFKVPRFTGAGGAIPLVYLRVVTPNKDAIGIFLRPDGAGYRVQAWTTPQLNSDWLRRIGDEGTAFHRMTLQYEAATQTATGWIDDKRIGAIKAPLAGKRQFMLVANTDKAGMDIDLVYDHFTVSPGLLGPGPVAPAAPAGVP